MDRRIKGFCNKDRETQTESNSPAGILTEPNFDWSITDWGSRNQHLGQRRTCSHTPLSRGRERRARAPSSSPPGQDTMLCCHDGSQFFRCIIAAEKCP
ncbi:hypothetical protein PFLUV_G00248320 [Perca fluviatilis]|uniref:Uncharacterized protein n=1 Tax=Perca fluviatilis TaxID=8168 RepID=A0A6A5E1X3_PERFL|nr:hypothetical protein PFLUV_G00248320 [Perca fluviatilis]